MATTTTISIEAMLSSSMTQTMFRQLCDESGQLADGSVNSYLGVARRILSEIYSSDLSLFTLPLLLNVEKVSAFVEDDAKVPSLHSKKAMYVVCAKLLSNFKGTPPEIIRLYQGGIERTRERIDAALVQQQPTPAEARGFEMLSNLPGRVAELLAAFEASSSSSTCTGVCTRGSSPFVAKWPTCSSWDATASL